MSEQSREFGNEAESLVCNKLLSSGYIILERNFSSRFGEIDIIAGKNNRISFIEVKARTSSAFGSGEEMIDFRKIGRIFQTSQIWIQLNNFNDDDIEGFFYAIVNKDKNSQNRIVKFCEIRV